MGKHRTATGNRHSRRGASDASAATPPTDTDPLHHRWDLSPAEARALQAQLARHVERRDRLPDPIRRVAGTDLGFPDRHSARAAIAVLSFPALEPLEQVVIERPCDFPYVPGLLSFREIPALLEALARLREPPDLILCDGQGYAHPRRFGLASHLGVYTGLATIGVAKTRLIGTHTEPGPAKGDWAPLIDREETIGAVLRSRGGVSPLYVSIGHRVCLETAIRLTLACTPRYRLPETTRVAHRLASGC